MIKHCYFASGCHFNRRGVRPGHEYCDICTDEWEWWRDRIRRYKETQQEEGVEDIESLESLGRRMVVESG